MVAVATGTGRRRGPSGGDPLGHHQRERIYRFIEGSPGVHFSGILRQLELSNGVVVHHLAALEREGLVRSRKDGQYRRYYPERARIPDKQVAGLSWFQMELLRSIERSLGVTPSELAALHKASKQVVNYHLRHLERLGLVRVARSGGRSAYWATAKATVLAAAGNDARR